MFHIFTASMKQSKFNVRHYEQVDVESINFLAEIRYQLLDDKNQKSRELHETFFKCLVQSTDFWINQSLVRESQQTLNEQFWLLVKTIYAQDPVDFHKLFPIQILVTLMSQIGQMYTKDTGSAQNCCQYHQKASKLLSHESFRKNKALKVSEKSPSHDGFVLVGINNKEVDGFQFEDVTSKELANPFAQRDQEHPASSFVFFPHGFDQSKNSEEREFDVQRLLEPITAVLEAVLNASCGQFSDSQQDLVPPEILDIIKFIS